VNIENGMSKTNHGYVCAYIYYLYMHTRTWLDKNKDWCQPCYI